jgi:hypothetical protein
MAKKAAKSRKPVARGKRSALSAESAVEVEEGDILIRLDDETHFLYQARTRSFLPISLDQRSGLIEHFADARAAVEKAPICVPMACRRVEGGP